MDDDLIVCRCEEITVGDVRRAIREGARDLNGIKRRIRAGMGLCQGRTCENLVVRILCQELRCKPGDVVQGSVRPPVTPVPFGVLAGVGECDE
ncbi:MAG: (2Fe-2S)-binding protein [Ignavibacteriales bacterium]